jgi:hypothetical protein
MEAKAPTEDIAAKASMEEAALSVRAEWEAFRVEAPAMLEAAFRVEAVAMLEVEAAVMLEAAFRVEAVAMLEVEAAVTLEVGAVMLEAEAAAVTTEH